MNSSTEPARSDGLAAEPLSSVYELSDVTKVYGSGNTQVRALDSIDLTVARGDFLAIVGASGSGKTTLLQLLGALDRPTTGQVTLLGQGPHHARRPRPHAPSTRHDRLRLPTVQPDPHTDSRRQRRNRDRDTTLIPPSSVQSASASYSAQLVSPIGSHHLPSQLSGGEQQRVAIARALANRPAVLLADEPTGNLDTQTGNEIIELLNQLVENANQTIVLITHEPAVAAAAQRTISLKDGHIITDTQT
jgi:ABC-type lipoprotein export system ATPase subunit